MSRQIILSGILLRKKSLSTFFCIIETLQVYFKSLKNRNASYDNEPVRSISIQFLCNYMLDSLVKLTTFIKTLIDILKPITRVKDKK